MQPVATPPDENDPAGGSQWGSMGAALCGRAGRLTRFCGAPPNSTVSVACDSWLGFASDVHSARSNARRATSRHL